MTRKLIAMHPWVVQLKLLVVILLGFVAVANGGLTPASDAQEAATAKKELTLLEKKWGIQFESIRMTANDHMVDFRYRVLDADKAQALFDRKSDPYLQDHDSGKVLGVPNTAKIGPLRTSNKPKEGRIYWMFFGNTGVVKTGDKVTVVIGDFKAENLVVQ